MHHLLSGDGWSTTATCVCEEYLTYSRDFRLEGVCKVRRKDPYCCAALTEGGFVAAAPGGGTYS